MTTKTKAMENNATVVGIVKDNELIPEAQINLYNSVVDNIRAFSTSKSRKNNIGIVAINLSLLYVDEQYQGLRNHKRINKLVDNWDERKLAPITVVPHPEEYRFAVVDIEWNDDINIETCYVSRTYLTRHGAGKFPSECNKNFINEYMYDKTNVPNPFQDNLRYGHLNLRELYNRCSDDIGDFGNTKSIAITHCNEYDKWDNDLLINLFNDWNIYYSDGETRNDVDLR